MVHNLAQRGKRRTLYLAIRRFNHMWSDGRRLIVAPE